MYAYICVRVVSSMCTYMGYNVDIGRIMDKGILCIYMPTFTPAHCEAHFVLQVVSWGTATSAKKGGKFGVSPRSNVFCL
jgi:hypothetical protein